MWWTDDMPVLIRPAELARMLDESPPDEHDVAVVDVQWSLSGPPGRTAYLSAHVPGAHFVDLDAELAGPPGPGGRHPLPGAASVQAALRRCGVDDATTVVVYDQMTSQSAARAWWVFRDAGVADVRVLDGGLGAWQAAGLPVTADVPEPGGGTIEVRPGQMSVLDAGAAGRLATEGVLLDARAAERYAGETEPIDPVAGHIPGSVNAPMGEYTREDGTLLPVEDLREYFAARGADGSRAIGTSCGSGVTAAHTALALEVLGIRSSVYIGSWSEWIRDPGRPVATGHHP
jgi:thiosulfate/3-mercaptopyruvate sulfurtransferase